MRKKILSVFLVLCLVLSFISFNSNVSFADSNSIKLRIEGRNSTLFNKQVTVADAVYGYDLMIDAFGSDNIDSTYYESWDSYMINGLLGEYGRFEESYSTSWMYCAIDNGNLVQPWVGINKFNVDGIEELIFYKSAADSNWKPLTSLPDMELTNDGNEYELTVADAVYGIENAKVNISYSNIINTNQNGKVNFEIGKGIYDVVVSKGNQYPEILTQHVRIQGEDSNLIINAVEDLKDYYSKDGVYSFREAMSLNHTSGNVVELESINNKYTVSQGVSASAYAGNIIGLIASGNNPSDHNEQNYVDLLASSQNEDGKFLIGQYDDYASTLAYSMIALDMVGEDYNRTKAVEALISYQNEGSFGSIDDTAIAIMALANYKDVAGVEDVIKASIVYLKASQLDSAGFEAWGAENPYSISAVIQALVVNNINPLGEEWIKNENTMLDALLQFKEGDHFKYDSYYGTDISMATEQAFCALADLYNGRSMYENITYLPITAEQDFTVTRVGSGDFEKGKEARLEVNVKNNTNTDEQMTFIVALYDTSQNEMINYTYITKTLDAGQNENLAGGFLIPSSGDYEVRGFLWDDMMDMNALAEPIIVQVQ